LLAATGAKAIARPTVKPDRSSAVGQLLPIKKMRNPPNAEFCSIQYRLKINIRAQQLKTQQNPKPCSVNKVSMKLCYNHKKPNGFFFIAPLLSYGWGRWGHAARFATCLLWFADHKKRCGRASGCFVRRQKTYIQRWMGAF
jgi:hypothetical protein